MHAELGQDARALNLLAAIDAAGRNDFDHGDELAFFHQRADAGALAEAHGRGLAADLDHGAALLDVGLGMDGAHGRAHGAGVIGGGAAASAHELRASGESLAGEAGHVLGRAEIDVAALDGAGHAGVGHGGDGQRGGGAHGLNGGEHGGRASGAVDADGVSAGLSEQGRGVRGRGTVEAIALVVHCDHDQHGKVGSGFARGQQGLAGFIQRRHGFNHDEVSAGGGERGDLFLEGGARLVEAGLAQRLQGHAEGTDRAGDPGFAGLLVAQMGDGLFGQAHAGGVDVGHFAGEAVAGEAEAVGAEGIGFKNLCAGLEIFLVHGEDELGIGEVQLVVAAVDEDAAPVEHGAHRAVGKNRTIAKDLGNAGHDCSIVLKMRGWAEAGELRFEA